MHSIHTTQGFIVGSRPYGDAGRILTIFTREHGLIYATAQGIRLEKSKLRYYTQEYSFGIYSFVRGREYWRMTSASETIERRNNLTIERLEEGTPAISGSSATGNEERGLIARIAILLRRLLQGEDPHPELFDIVFECWRFLGDNNEEMNVLESLVVARILSALGYIGDIKGLSNYLKSSEITREMLIEIASQRTTLNQHINKALKESML